MKCLIFRTAKKTAGRNVRVRLFFARHIACRFSSSTGVSTRFPWRRRILRKIFLCMFPQIPGCASEPYPRGYPVREAVVLLYGMIWNRAPAKEILIPSVFRDRASISDKKANEKAKQCSRENGNAEADAFSPCGTLPECGGVCGSTGHPENERQFSPESAFSSGGRGNSV